MRESIRGVPHDKSLRGEPCAMGELSAESQQKNSPQIYHSYWNGLFEKKEIAYPQPAWAPAVSSVAFFGVAVDYCAQVKSECGLR